MSQTIERRRIRCRSDDGSEHTIIEYQEMIDVSPVDRTKSVPGLKTLVDSLGRHCNFTDDDTFEIVVTGQIVRKV